ncbi:MAG TPA: hypothetical protein VFW87_11310 [Pirellulales bacterium]|nr:hypothetical protein [Pirellulales bacterium]
MLLVVLAHLGLAVASAAGSAAEVQQRSAPGIELSRYVSPDVGLCLELRQLETHARRFLESELFRRLQTFPPFAAMLAQQRPNWLAIAGEVERRTGATAGQLYSGLLGRQVLFAVWPPAEGRSPKGDALLLIEAADPELLGQSLHRLVEARRAANRWHGRRTIEAAGRAFALEAVARDDEPSDIFLAVDGELGMMATSEAVIRGVLERRAGAAAASLATLPFYAAAVERLSADCVARAFISPRAWDAALLADLRNKPPRSDEARTQQAVVDAWRTTEYVVGGVELTPRVAIELAWQWQSDALPQPLREVAAGLAGRSQFIDRIPADAWLAVAGRIDLARIVRHFIAEQWRGAGDSSDAASASSSVPPETIVAWALAAGLGPDFSAYCRSPSNDLTGVGPAAPALVAAPSNSDAPRPVAPALVAGPSYTDVLQSRDESDDAGIEAVAAVQTRPLEPVDSSPPLAETAAPLLHALLAAAVEATNARHPAEQADIETAASDGLSVTTVSGLKAGSRSLAFAYAVTDGVLWLGTSAAAVRQRVAASPDDSLLARDDVRRQLGSLIAEPSDLFYVDLVHWRRLLSAGPNAVRFLWQGQSLDPAARQKQYQTLVALSRLADRLLAAAQIDDAGVSLSLSFMAGDP